DPHRKPGALIKSHFFFHAWATGGFDHNAILDQLQRVDGYAAGHFRREPHSIFTQHRAWWLAVGRKGKERTVGYEGASLAIAVDRWAPGELRPGLHVLASSSWNAIDAAPVGEHVRPGTRRDTEA